jgi:uncharacterized protein YecE (DUF72 family)
VSRHLIGCSGWSYPWWEGNFYPVGVRERDHLAYYSRKFPTVEVNMTFYRFPTVHIIEGWRDSTPEDFIFAMKMNRTVTHFKKLKGAERMTDSFISSVDNLGEKLGPILLQLPPDLGPDLVLLEGFLSSLPVRQYALEFRDKKWIQRSTLRLLERYNVAIVMTDPPPPESPLITAEFAYVRWHGRSGAGYEYDVRELREWADLLEPLDVKTVFGYFNNDQGGAAPRNAQSLNELLEHRQLSILA